MLTKEDLGKLKKAIQPYGGLNQVYLRLKKRGVVKTYADVAAVMSGRYEKDVVIEEAIKLRNEGRRKQKAKDLKLKKMIKGI